MDLRTQLNLPRRIAHARDAGEVPRVEEVQRPRQVERRRVRDIECLGANLELPLPADLELLRDAEIQLPQRRSGHLAARAAERAEVGLSDGPNWCWIRKRRWIVELIDIVTAGVRIADEERVAAGTGA